MAKIAAVLFDVGGPINTEIEHERLIDADIMAAVSDCGIDVTPRQYADAVAFAVHSYAPDAHPAIVWHLVRGDRELAARAFADFHGRAHTREMPFQLRAGIGEVIEWLHGLGLRLGLAANQPHATLHVLEKHGLGRYFHHREVSGTHGYRKPDVRLFLRACEDLGIPPESCVMVGDRVDNDVAPAKLLGMRTVLFRTGRHIDQQPRSHDEIPDAEVRSVEELRHALERMLDAAGE